MSWLLCCLRPATLHGSGALNEGPCPSGAAKPSSSPTKTASGASLPGCITTSQDQAQNSPPRPLVHATLSRVPKGSQQGLRLSEDTVLSAFSTTPTSLNPLAYFLPFGSDEHDEISLAHTRESVDALGCPAPQQPRSKVDFADLCGSLEDLQYVGEGSNGVVYSASWHGARVAVKFLLGNNDDSTHRERCFTEAVLTRVLSHPCVVQCFATAIAQLTPEVWEGIRARCQRHQSILQSCSLGRSVAAAVLQQQEQELAQAAAVVCTSDFPSEQWDPSPQLHPASMRRNQRPRSANPQTPSPRCSLNQHHPPALLLPHRSQLQPSGLPSRPDSDLQPQPQPCEQLHSYGYPCGLPDTDGMLLDMRKVERLFTEDGGEVDGCGDGALTGTPTGAECLDGEPPSHCEGVSLMQALLDLKAESGRHCTVVVMEYMDAGTLHDSIVRGEFSARRSLEHRSKLLALLLTAKELAQGMAHLHNLDILHGDLKPTNVLLKGTPCQYAGGPPGSGAAFTCTDPRGYTAKIADLGLARPCPGETAALSSDQWGALAYLAPEAAKGSCCKASDVYSFGVMLWEMSAGVRPYLGLTHPQVLMGLVTGTLQLTWPGDGSLYAPLRSLAIACTDFNPAERPTFEVAARILGRMVRHIRSASEPLRQRHSSALSMETGGPGCGSGSCGCGCGGSPANCVLNHAPRSMPVYLPNSGAAGVGIGCGSAAAAAATLAAAAAAHQQSASLPLGLPSGSPPGIGASTMVAAAPVPARYLVESNSPWTATAAAPAGSVTVAPSRCMTGTGGGPGGALSGLAGLRPPSGGIASPSQPLRPSDSSTCHSKAGGVGMPVRRLPAPAQAGSSAVTVPTDAWLLGAPSPGPAQQYQQATQQLRHPQPVPQLHQQKPQQAQQQPQQPVVKLSRMMRRGVNGQVCGGPVVRSPLGQSASLRGLPATPYAPADGREAVWVATGAPRGPGERPGPSPAHTHVS